ncbi:hypothetical protein BDI4_210054 [Burkholderia diffusa]|nr:hypothetical protein BDI4_210054 [Burkholderia diffusa]
MFNGGSPTVVRPVTLDTETYRKLIMTKAMANIAAASADTFETKQQILAHDRAVAKNCPSGTP